MVTDALLGNGFRAMPDRASGLIKQENPPPTENRACRKTIPIKAESSQKPTKSWRQNSTTHYLKAGGSGRNPRQPTVPRQAEAEVRDPWGLQEDWRAKERTKIALTGHPGYRMIAPMSKPPNAPPTRAVARSAPPLTPLQTLGLGQPAVALAQYREGARHAPARLFAAAAAHDDPAARSLLKRLLAGRLSAITRTRALRAAVLAGATRNARLLLPNADVRAIHESLLQAALANQDLGMVRALLRVRPTHAVATACCARALAMPDADRAAALAKPFWRYTTPKSVWCLARRRRLLTTLVRLADRVTEAQWCRARPTLPPSIQTQIAARRAALRWARPART